VTRKRAESRPPEWRAVTGYGEIDEVADRSILPPTKYRDAQGRDRYGVTVRGTLRPFRVELVTIKDRENGITMTFTASGTDGPPTWRTAAIADVPADLTPEAMKLLWREGQELAGWTRKKLGAPSKQRERIANIVQATAELGEAATVDNVAQTLGRVTEYGERHGDFNRDVAAAGGFALIKQLAGVE
jgi:hypothetical protein